MSKILKILSQKRQKTIFLIMGLVLFLSLMPLHFAHAWFDWVDVISGLRNIFLILASIPLRVGFAIVMISIAIGALFTGVIYRLIVIITAWILNVSLQVGITPNNPLTPEIVDIGWTFTRDFANIFFILVLVFIGLATILQLRDYQAKKSLPKLLLVIFLINFTPVIVGFIVDMANIVTNFFIVRTGDISATDIVAKVWKQIVEESLSELIAPIENIMSLIREMMGIIVYGIVAIAFFLLGSWVYFWVMLAFFLRIVNLWILMILAPIAFLSYVFPPSKEVKRIFPNVLHWDGWWEELLQWALLGIPLGFFLYLSNWIMKNTTAVQDSLQTAILESKLGSGAGLPLLLEPAFIELIISIMAPVLALLFLRKGYKIAKETAPAGAKAITEGVKKAVGVATALGVTAITAGAAAGATAGGVSWAAGKVVAGAQRLERFTGKISKMGKGAGRLVGTPLKYGVAKPIKWATRGVETAIVPQLERYAARTRRIKLASEFNEMSVAEQERFVQSQLLERIRVQYTAKMVDLNTLDKTSKDFQKKMAKAVEGVAKDPHLKKEIATLMDVLPTEITAKMAIDFEVDEAKKEELENKIKGLAAEISVNAAFQPRVQARAIEEGITETQAARDFAAGAIHLGRIKPGDVSKIADKEFWNAPGAMEFIQKFWSGSHYRNTVDKFGKKFIDDYMENIKAMGDTAVPWFLVNNPSGLIYLTGNAAQDLGLSAPEGLTREQAREAVDRWRRGGP